MRFGPRNRVSSCFIALRRQHEFLRDHFKADVTLLCLLCLFDDLRNNFREVRRLHLIAAGNNQRCEVLHVNADVTDWLAPVFDRVAIGGLDQFGGSKCRRRNISAVSQKASFQVTELASVFGVFQSDANGSLQTVLQCLLRIGQVPNLNRDCQLVRSRFEIDGLGLSEFFFRQPVQRERLADFDAADFSCERDAGCDTR